MELKKVKYTQTGGVEVTYRKDRTITKDIVSKTDVTEKCKDEPHPDFLAALKSLEPIIKHDEGLPAKAVVKATGASFFNDGETVIITHAKENQSGTNGRSSGRISFESETFKMVDELFNALQVLKSETIKYIVDKKRAQLDLFIGDEKEGPVEKKSKVMEAV